jgi:hypothetical protein
LKQNLNKKMLLIIFIVINNLIFTVNTHAQTSQSLYLNRVGFCDIEVGYDVNVVGDIAYVTNNDGLILIDVENPQIPQIMGESLIGGSYGFIIEESKAYVASVPNGFTIIDISTPSNPTILGSDSTRGANKITVLNSYAYVSYLNGRLKIFNISDPSTPTLIGEYVDTRIDHVQIKDDIIYLSNPEVGLKVINVSNPLSPQFITTVSQTGGVNDVHITNNTLYLARWGNGVTSLDISNPIAPTLLDTINDNDGGEELGLVEKNKLLYVADNYGVELFNVTDPSSIIEIAERTEDVIAAHEIDVDDDYIYVAQGGGLLILEVSTTPEGGDWLFYTILVSSVFATALISIIFYLRFIEKRKTDEL